MIGSLSYVLRKVKERRGTSIYTKSGVMLGLGETQEELFTAMEDLRGAGCDILTLGQHLQPTLKHLPVAEFVSPEKFDEFGDRARQMGFVHVASGLMVRSSYHADEFTFTDCRGVTDRAFSLGETSRSLHAQIAKIIAMIVTSDFQGPHLLHHPIRSFLLRAHEHHHFLLHGVNGRFVF